MHTNSTLYARFSPVAQQAEMTVAEVKQLKYLCSTASLYLGSCPSDFR